MSRRGKRGFRKFDPNSNVISWGVMAYHTLGSIGQEIFLNSICHYKNLEVIISFKDVYPIVDSGGFHWSPICSTRSKMKIQNVSNMIVYCYIRKKFDHCIREINELITDYYMVPTFMYDGRILNDGIRSINWWRCDIDTKYSEYKYWPDGQITKNDEILDEQYFLEAEYSLREEYLLDCEGGYLDSEAEEYYRQQQKLQYLEQQQSCGELKYIEWEQFHEEEWQSNLNVSSLCKII